MQWGIYAKPP